MGGELTDRYGQDLALEQWWGVDPDVREERVSPGGVHLVPGTGHDLPFGNDHFDCVVFANVYEHVTPQMRRRTLAEIHRVLIPGGILVGQLPNPYFPIESHSRLPFFGYLPRRVQRRYWRLSPTGWNFDAAHFFRVDVRNLRKAAEAEGFRTVLVRGFSYTAAALPRRVAWAAALHAKLGLIPWSWQFVLRKPTAASESREKSSGG